MSEKVLFEFIADDGEGNSETRVAGDFIPNFFSFAGHCGCHIHSEEFPKTSGPGFSRRARRRVRRTLDMFEDFYDEIFREGQSEEPA
jgi:hypothetical protein